MSKPSQTQAQAERVLLHELAHWWRQLNASHFQKKLQAPVLAFSDSDTQLGRWKPASRTLELSRHLVSKKPWIVVIEVLKHEMAHQFVTEVLEIHDETAHGPAFRSVCAIRGIDPTATGMPTARLSLSEGEERTLRRIQRLLALAESPNAHEAQAAMNAAQKLMLKHNIQVTSAGTPSHYGFRQLGRPRKRIPQHEHVLAGLLCGHFFVSAVWIWIYDRRTSRRAKVLEITGTTANLEMASYVHSYLLAVGERLWVHHKRAQRIPSDRERRRFLQGVMVGFGETLKEQETRSREEGLVWVGDGDLMQYVGQRHPHLRSGRGIRMHITDSWQHGRAAGREIVIRRPISNDVRKRGRLLEG